MYKRKKPYNVIQINPDERYYLKNVYEKALSLLEENECNSFHELIEKGGRRLNHCKAWYVIKGNVGVLLSYNHIIGFYYDGTFCDILRSVYGYTSTSTQHLYKFMKKITNDNGFPIHRIIKTNARQYDKLVEIMPYIY